MNRYPLAYDEHASTGRAVALVRSAGREPGVILDLGAGPGAVAEALRELGFEYVATDVDADALAVVAARGFETHELGLVAPEDDLVESLTAIVGGRSLAAVLALDVLEHLPEPAVVLRALRRLVGSTRPADAPLVISVPNVTHFDVGAKLLMGRWDVDDGGLLDDTHLRFFSEGELARLLHEGGWTVDAAHDTVAEVSDQCWPVDAPALRPGAPLRDLLRAVRDDAAPGATTYQFVRRLLPSREQPGPAPYSLVRDEELPPLAVIVVETPGDPPLSVRADLDAQTRPADEVVVVGSLHDVATTLRDMVARHVVVLGAGCRLDPEWAATVADAASSTPGQVVRVPTRLVDVDPEVPAWDELVGDAPADPIDPLDLLHAAPPLPFVAAAFAVPIELARSAGVVPARTGTREDLAAWLALAAQLCGVHIVDGRPVLAAVRPRAADGATVAAAIVEHLDHRPMVLPAGSARRLVLNRDRLTAAEAEAIWLRQRLAADEEAKEQLAHHLRLFGAELDAVRPELETLRREHARRPSRRLAAWVRRILG